MKSRGQEVIESLIDNLPLYAADCLKIRTKSESLKSLNLNKAQLYIHQRLEQQLERTGKIRALILKGRQQGCSTYVEARFIWKVTQRRGVRAFILTHLDDATQNIFNMAKRYYDNLPDVMKPSISASNAKELIFNKLDSGFKVGTAKSQGTGRSDTIQYFHGSEVAYWHDADSHFSGAVQAVPNADGTEIILESTANGVGGRFHDMCKDAIAGKGEYQLIFIPWFWQDEYRATHKEFEITPEEEEIKKLYKLDDNQLMWRRDKIIELGSEGMFKQEYPCNPSEAFMFSGQESFITVASVEKAAKTTGVRPAGERVLGVDVATVEGEDCTAFTLRQGRVILWTKTEPTWGPAKAKREIIRMFEEREIDRCNIDENGVGYGLVDELELTQWKDKVHGIKSSETAMRDDKYCLVRDELYGNFKDWLEDTPCQIPDDEKLKQDILTAGWNKKNGKIKIESKDEIKKRIKRSPDHGDSAMLTTAHINSKLENEWEKQSNQSFSSGAGTQRPRIGGIA